MILQKGVEMVNAYFCGLVNALIDGVNGLLWIIQMIYKLKAGLVEFKGSLDENIAWMQEAMDAFFSFITDPERIKVLFLGIVNGVWDWIKSINFNIKLDVNIDSSTPVIISYFIGNLAGFIIQIIIEAYLTGGTKAAISVMQKLGSGTSKIMDDIAAKFTRFLDFGEARETTT